MIKIEKGSAPQFLLSETVDLAIEKLEQFYAEKNRSQKRYNFPFNKEIDHEIKRDLHTIFHGKCGYCESKVDEGDIFVVDRFRPFDGVRDKKEYFQDLYWWLTFDWDNLVYSCKECAQYKANYFPIKGKRATTRDQSLESEKPLLLNPCTDNPDLHFDCTAEILISDTEQGNQTIELLKLNRTTLTERRKTAFLQIRDIIDRIGNEVEPETEYLNQILNKDPRIEFLLVKHKFLIAELDRNPQVRQYLSNEGVENGSKIDLELRKPKRGTKTIVTSDYFPIEYIEIKNFKSISFLRIDFPSDELEQHSWITLLGENGLGKSSILQAICLGIAPNIKNHDTRIGRLIKKGENEALILVKQRDSNNTLTTRLFRTDNIIEHRGEFFSALVGYGSTRLLPSDNSNPKKTRRRVKFENLFNPLVPLDNVLNWIVSMFKDDQKSFDLIAVALKELLPEEVNDDLVVENEELIFKKSGIPYQDLSDGYKGTIALALDIMKTLSDGRTDFSKLTGIVLIDELGNQLHPRWQMRVVKQLKKAFPKVNFIVSTHHPLCLRGLDGREVIVLGKDANKVIYAVQELPNPASMRVDQLLASEFFGLSSLIDPEIEANFNKYYGLLSKGENATDSEKNEIDRLKDILRNKNQMGASVREELMYTVIDKLFAQKVIYNKQPLKREELKREVVQRVKEVWQKLNLSEDDQDQ